MKSVEHTGRSWRAAFRFIWGIVGEDVTNAVKTRRVVCIPTKPNGSDYTDQYAARLLVKSELEELAMRLKDAITGRNLDFYELHTWAKECRVSCYVLGLGDEAAPCLSVAAFIASMGD